MHLAKQADWGVMTGRLPDLDDRRVRAWLDLVEARTGVVILPERKAFLMTGLKARMLDLGLDDYDSYYKLLSRDQAWSQEWSQLIDRLTVHETSFFRHAPSLQLLTQTILPGFVDRNTDVSRGFQAWSLGCATGEEPYTLAMVAQQYFDELSDGRRYGITATDISQSSLQTARLGVYGERRMRGVSKSLREKYCIELGDGQVQIADVLRRRICFAQLNALHVESFPLRDMDLIYCQNMLIYFPRFRRLQIIETLVKRLAPGGVLVLGPGDLPSWAHPEFTRVRFEGTLAYQRQAAVMASA
jgi:chemotaxis protein methyltransferase CheR/type IV pilus assembly protein PilK